MERPQLQDTVLTVVIHLAAVGVNMAAGISLGAPASGPLTAAVLAIALGVPVAGLALGALGRVRAGALALMAAYALAAALGVYNLLGLGVLNAALQSDPGTGWRMVFFLTAMLLPLVQVKGILEVGSVLWAEEHGLPGKGGRKAADW